MHNLRGKGGVAQNALRHLRSGLAMQFVGDSKILIDCLLGDASTSDPELSKFVRVAHAGLRTLTENFGIRAPGVEVLARQVPRSDNSAADAAANWALDHDSFMDVRLEDLLAFVHALGQSSSKQIGVLFSFDGAARGNPGPSSSGVCAWWGMFYGDLFESRGLLLQKGTKLGTGTNNSSEAHGLATALKTSLRWNCLVIEQLSHLALHTVSDN